MGILKIKYKIHRLVNLAFYFITFALGFILGGGHIEKISNIFNNLFN